MPVHPGGALAIAPPVDHLAVRGLYLHEFAVHGFEPNAAVWPLAYSVVAAVIGATRNPRARGRPCCCAGVADEVNPEDKTNDAEPDDCHHNQRLHPVPPRGTRQRTKHRAGMNLATPPGFTPNPEGVQP